MSESAPALTLQQQQQSSLKRYKSVRQAQKQLDHAPPPPPIPVEIPQQQQDGGLQRSMSRYKGRARARTDGTQERPQAQPAVPRIPATPAYAQQNHTRGQHVDAANVSRNNRSLKRDTTAPPTGYPANGASARARARAGTDTGMKRQTSMPVESSIGSFPIQSPPRMSKQPAASSNGYSQVDTLTSGSPPAFNSMMQGQLYAMPQQQQAMSPRNQWTNTSALSDLQNEHNRKIKEQQRKEREVKRRAAEEIERQANEAQRAREEEERKAQEEVAHKAKEQRLVEQKVKDARKLFADRKKSTRNVTSRRLFSRSGHDAPGLPIRGSVDQQSQTSSGRREVLAPAAPESDLPVKQVDASVVARPYQSPPRVRKESISQPISHAPVDAISPPAGRPSADVSTKPVFFDAPKSAINAGERSVIISYKASNTILTVTNDTTVESLIRAAASEMSHEKINPETAILLESFEQQHVERRLRRYEHVRDILNSWDSDRQNKLLLVPSVTNGLDEDDLFASHVPRREPAETISLRMHHSYRHGHWDKRVVTLRPGGQVFVARDDAGKDGRVICTLSDFDIYIPTPVQAKRVKAPKKICFAIKSQERPSMFITGENFIHWFSTKDRQVADQWYVAIQAWRSWYLVEKMGMGRSKRVEPEVNAGLLGNVGGIGEMAAANNVQTSQLNDTGHSLGDDIFSSLSSKQKDKHEPNLFSKESLGYDLGGLINRIGENEFSPSSAPLGSLARSGTQKKSTQNSRGAPPSSYPQTLMSRLETNEEPTFAPTGLLGRTYTQRQKASQEGRPSLDPGRGETDWRKPLVDFSNKPQTTQQEAGPQRGRKFSFGTEEGPLIGRAGNYNE